MLTKGQIVKSYRNCCHTQFKVITVHRDGMVTVLAQDSAYGAKHRCKPDLFYDASQPDKFIPLHLPLPSGRM